MVRFHPSSVQPSSQTGPLLASRPDSKQASASPHDPIGAGAPGYMAVPTLFKPGGEPKQAATADVAIDVRPAPEPVTPHDSLIPPERRDTELHLLPLHPGAREDVRRPPTVWRALDQLQQDIRGDMLDLTRMAQHYAVPAHAYEGLERHPRVVLAAAALTTAGTFLGVYFGAIR